MRVRFAQVGRTARYESFCLKYFSKVFYLQPTKPALFAGTGKSALFLLPSEKPFVDKLTQVARPRHDSAGAFSALHRLA